MNIVMALASADRCADGLARSLDDLIDDYRKRGHQILVLAPASVDVPPSRMHANTILLRHLPDAPGGPLSLSFPLSAADETRVREFDPDVVHSHYPFIVGGAALRIAAEHAIPLIFSRHSTYQHEPATGSPYLRRLMAELADGYSRLADCNVAPSRTVAAFLQDRDVDTLIEVVPSGVNTTRFSNGQGAPLRARFGVPSDAFVAGCCPVPQSDRENKLLIQCMVRFLSQDRSRHVIFLGMSRPDALRIELARRSLSERVHLLDPTVATNIADCYAAMDVFLSIPRTLLESQEILESLAAGVPVITRDSPAAREWIHDGRNGRLVTSGSRDAFLSALEDTVAAAPAVRQQWQRSAREIAARYDTHVCGDRMLEEYSQAVESMVSRSRQELTGWEALRRRAAREWQLWTARAQAVGASLRNRQRPSRVPVLRHAVGLWRGFRRFISRREWSVRLLNLPVWEEAEDEPGLIILQIDGLSRHQLERAIRSGKMPFLKRVLNRDAYRIETMYPGQPATTPAVLGELYYGVPQAVPAFGFRDHRTGEVVQMFQPGIAARVERELADKGTGLLSEGCAYSVIYTGGAHDSSFCPASTGWRNIEDSAMWRRIALFLMNAMSLVRIAGLSLVEFAIAVTDCVRRLDGKEWREELYYVPRRVFVNVVLRELLAISVEADATRGVPIIHANFLGYDENAHRRGPDSRLARMSLTGIDRALRRIWNAAHASYRRNYHVWFMSDHGQQPVTPYDLETGRTIHDAVQAFYQRMCANKPATGAAPHASEVREVPLVVAVGPLGYIYWPEELSTEDTEQIASALQVDCAIPLVMARFADGAFAWTDSGRFRMPDEAAQVIGSNHPHLDVVATDLTSLCSHPDAGTFVISGWRPDGTSTSFVVEHGAHGGPGPDETSAFVLLPPDTPPHLGRLRPRTLRNIAQSVVGQKTSIRRTRSDVNSQTVRLVTYNVHSCVGLDGRLSVSRIARVLAAQSPDVVALQELDVGRAWSGGVDQASAIARMLEMEIHFHPCINVAGEEYGNAILSRFPIQLVKSELFAATDDRREPRGALWARITLGARTLDVITTHLGLSPRERLRQIEALLGPEWLEHPDCGEQVVLCGDFNAMPGSRVYRRVTRTLCDVQRALCTHRPRRTWFSPFPLSRIDHIFVAHGLAVSAVDVPRNELSRVASDHLPLCADLLLASRQAVKPRVPQFCRRE